MGSKRASEIAKICYKRVLRTLPFCRKLNKKVKKIKISIEKYINNFDVIQFWHFQKNSATFYATNVRHCTDSEKQPLPPFFIHMYIFMYLHLCSYIYYTCCHITTSQIKDTQQNRVFLVLKHMVGKWKFCSCKKKQKIPKMRNF